MRKKKIRTPLRYPGGKARVADMLVSLMPDFDEYREPFVGGGSVFLAAKQKWDKATYWINDLFYDVYAFWYMSEHNNNAIASYGHTIVGFKDKVNGKHLYRSLIDTSDKEGFNDVRSTAIRFFVLNRMTFSGTTLSGGFSQSAYEKRLTESSVKRVEDLEPILQGVNVTNEDYSELLKAEGENVFIFMDPPYYTATRSKLYGKDGNLHVGFDHEKFAQDVKACKHKWMITYDDCEYIRSLYKGYRIVPFEIVYGMKNVRKGADMKGSEIIIMNY